MHVHRLFADGEVARHQFVRPPKRDEAGDFLLARRQAGQQQLRALAPLFRDPLFAAVAHGGGNRIEQGLIAKRFFEKIKGPLLHRLHREFNITVTGHEHDGRHPTPGVQGLLEFQPIHAGHADVQHQTAKIGRWCRAGSQKVRCRGVRHNRPAKGLQQENERTPKRGVIVDDMDDRVASKFRHDKVV